MDGLDKKRPTPKSEETSSIYVSNLRYTFLYIGRVDRLFTEV